ncbi:MAG TPA: hypothetical protein VH740_07355 [Vicinamibacterales bacterium]|jgi:hypothetical protein
MSIVNALIQKVTAADFWQGVIAALVIALAALIGKNLWRWADRLRRPGGFDLAGYWMGTCILPSYEQPQLEIWRYRRVQEDITLTFFAYDAKQPKATKWRGWGVFRVHMLSAYYYLRQKGSYDSGVVALEVNAGKLRGIYAQFDAKKDKEPLYVSPTKRGADYYVQYPVSLPRAARLRMLAGFAPFRTFEEVQKLYDAVTAKPAAKPPAPIQPQGAP